VDEDEFLISVAMNRRHLTEGQKAVLAYEYMRVLSKKAKTQRAEIVNAVKAVNARWHPDKKYDEATVSSAYKDKVARWHPDMEYVSETVSETNNEEKKNDARKIASEKWKVSEWKVRNSKYSKVW